MQALHALVWATASTRIGEFAEAESVRPILEKAAARNAQLSSLVTHLEIALARQRGDFARTELFCHRLESDAVGEHAQGRARIILAEHLANAGRLTDAGRLPAADDPSEAHRIALLCAVDACERGDAHKLPSLLSRLGTGAVEARWLASLRLLGDMLLAVHNRSPMPAPDPMALPEAGQLLELAAGRVPDLSLPEYAYRATPSSWFCALPLRCALASRNREHARRLVDDYSRSGRNDPWLPLHRMRLAVLDGDLEAARTEVPLIAAHAERHQAHGRLAVELAMACELAPSTAMALLVAPPAAPIAPPRHRALQAVGSDGAASALRGADPRMAAVRARLQQVSPIDAGVLVVGATGTGKELAVRALHAGSPRARRPLVAVNCAAIPDSLVESELFGHERGSFTGADARRIGMFEEAGDGTLYLDEIGDASPRFQAALLRVLENREFRRVGGSQTLTIGCRLVASLAEDPERLVRAGRLREDLRWRLAQIVISLPSLHERQGDISLLASHFLSSAQGGRPVSISPALADRLRREPWPGNVRQLRSQMEHLAVVLPGRSEYGLGDWQALHGEAPVEHRRGRAGTSVSERTGVYERMGEALRRRGEATRAELMAHLHISGQTATRYLAQLLSAGVIEKIEPNRSPNSHYFRWRG